MKIEFDKALLWGIPYLYITSIMYYWGYWGTFDIDAFSYYDVGDILKGVIGPIRLVLYFTISVVGIYQTNELIHSPLKGNILKMRWWAAVSSIILMTVIGFIIYVSVWYGLLAPFVPRSPDVDNWARLTILNSLCFVLGFTVVSSFKKTEWTLGWWLLVIGVALPPRAFLAGKENALLITENKVFNYVVADSLVYPRQGLYKFLGKAGSHNILLSMDNTKEIIVPMDKIVPLIIEGYSVMDTASISRFRRNSKLINVYQEK